MAGEGSYRGRVTVGGLEESGLGELPPSFENHPSTRTATIYRTCTCPSNIKICSEPGSTTG